jgi:hypothetical protein
VDCDFRLVVAQDVERPDVRVHVRRHDAPVEIVIAVDVGVGRQTQLAAPAAQKTAPEKVADGHAVRLFVMQRLVHAV